MQARIVTVADTFDAMTTTRPYQKAMEIGYVVERIKSFSGVRYDPVVVVAFLRACALGELVPPPREEIVEPADELSGSAAAGPLSRRRLALATLALAAGAVAGCSSQPKPAAAKTSAEVLLNERMAAVLLSRGRPWRPSARTARCSRRTRRTRTCSTASGRRC